MIIKEIIFVIFLLYVYNCEANPHAHLNELAQHGEQAYTKVYSESISAHDFLTSNSQNSNPAKFVSYTSHVAGLFDGRNENKFIDNSINSLLFGNMSEAAKNSKIETTTSLKKFFNMKDQYSYETEAEFGVPTVVR
jgi:hypothetical protein